VTYIAIAPQGQTNVTGPRVTWGTAETTILTGTVNRTGYWWAAAQLTIFSGSSDQVTIRLRANGVQQAAGTIWNVQWYGSPLLVPSAPVLMTNGQSFTLTAQSASLPANNAEAQTMLSFGFVPTQQYPK